MNQMLMYGVINMRIIKNILVIIASMFVGLSLVGCSSEEESQDQIEKSRLDGLLILQVYGVGEGGTNSPALSHSFVELYNNTNSELDLTGASLQYSEGGSTWSYLALDGTVAAKSSYLVVANEYGDYTREEISSGDQTWNITIENKGVKVCLLDTTTRIAVENPFNVNGSPMSGYVDMVCSVGYGDTIDACEGAFVEGQSKQKSVRRLNLVDTNNNSNDFGLVDFSTLPDSLIDIYLPKNTTYGTHDPFEGIEQVETTNSIVILQVYGTGNNNDTPINRSFVELYNTSNADISLDGYSLQYIDEDDNLLKLDLEGTIKANRSFLIGGVITSVGDTVNINITDDDVDMTCDWKLDNKILTIVLLNSTTELTNFDAFNQFKNGELDSFVDMVGISSNYFEVAPATDLSKQKSLRRVSLNDTNNNSNDFTIIDYRLDKGLSLEELKELSPKCTLDGKWDPFF